MGLIDTPRLEVLHRWLSKHWMKSHKLRWGVVSWLESWLRAWIIWDFDLDTFYTMDRGTNEVSRWWRIGPLTLSRISKPYQSVAFYCPDGSRFICAGYLMNVEPEQPTQQPEIKFTYHGAAAPPYSN